MAEEGRGQRHSAPKVAPVTGQNFFKSFDTPSGRAKRQKGHCMELQGGALFWFSPKFTPSKIFEPRKFFPAFPLLPTKIFPFLTKKSRQKGLRPPTSQKRAKKKAIFEWQKRLIGFKKHDIIYNGSTIPPKSGGDSFDR